MGRGRHPPGVGRRLIRAAERMAHSMEEMLNYMKRAVAENASDLFVVSGMPVCLKEEGSLKPADEIKVMPDRAGELVRELYALAKRDIRFLEERGDDDFSLSVVGLARFRVNAYRQRGSLAAVIRVVRFEIPDRTAMGLPDEVMKVAELSRGLVLVTGPAGSGKSTTMACITDTINRNRSGHIITIEDPIEYLHRDINCIVSQRELSTDTDSYATAMRASLRQAPDVIMLGEMRDQETIQTAMTAAETGHLVISTLHTVGAVNTIDRIIDVFPPNQQQQIRVQLAMVLKTVISQQLLPTLQGGMTPAFEIMHLNNAIRTLIRDSRTHQINAAIQSSAAEGMIGMDESILRLARAGKVSKEVALRYAMEPDPLQRKLG